MNITLTAAKSQYLEQVAAGLADLPEEEREEVVQDLSAHLAELADDEIFSVLGTPPAFVSEFRASAGLDEERRVPGLIRTARSRLSNWSDRLGRLTNWPRWRMLWVWTRGWLILSVYAGINETVAFHHFPIPAIESTIFGAILLVGVTWLSVWIDRRPRGWVRDLTSVVFSTLGIWALVVGLLGGIALGYPAEFVDFEDQFFSDYPLISQGGEPVENIYAFDTEGNPVEVLLFDQAGRPLRTMPQWVYQEAEMNPSGEGVEYPNGVVIFLRDEFGRIIPNLYPLDLERWDEWGDLRPAEPPAAWSSPDEERFSTPPTTTSHTDPD